LVERAQKRFVEVHSKYNKKQGQTACDCGGKDGEFWQMLADPKKYLLCAKEACPGLELRPGDDAPQFHLEACSDGTCEVCGWDEEKATRKKMPAMPTCWSSYQDFGMSWEQYQMVVDPFQATYANTEAHTAASDDADEDGEDDLGSDTDEDEDEGDEVAADADATDNGDVESDEEEEAEQDQEEAGECESGDQNNSQSQKPKPKMVKKLRPCDGPQHQFYDTFCSTFEPFALHSHQVQWHGHAQKRCRSNYDGKTAMMIESDFSNKYPLTKYGNECCESDPTCTLMPVYVYWNAREMEVEVNARDYGDYTDGSYTVVTKTVTRRVHDTEVWFLVSKDPKQDFAVYRQFVLDQIIPYYKDAFSKKGLTL
jgi:hypothetical protein